MDIGAELKKARIARAKYIPQIAHELKVPATVIQAVERNDFAACGTDAECRAIIVAYANAVGVDAEPLVNSLASSGGIEGVAAAQAAEAAAAAAAEAAAVQAFAEAKAAAKRQAEELEAHEREAARAAELAAEQAKLAAKKMASERSAAEKAAAKAAAEAAKQAEKEARAAAKAAAAELAAARRAEALASAPAVEASVRASSKRNPKPRAKSTQTAKPKAPRRQRAAVADWLAPVGVVLVLSAAVAWAFAEDSTTGSTPAASVTASPTATATPSETATPSASETPTASSEPSVSPTPTPAPTYLVSRVSGTANFTITVLKPVSLHLYNADGTIFTGRLKAGDVRKFSSDIDATLTTTDASAISLRVSGEDLGVLGEVGQTYTHKFRVG